MVELYFLDASIPLNDSKQKHTTLKHVLSCTCVVSLLWRSSLEIRQCIEIANAGVCFIPQSPPVPCGNGDPMPNLWMLRSPGVPAETPVVFEGNQWDGMEILGMCCNYWFKSITCFKRRCCVCSLDGVIFNLLCVWKDVCWKKTLHETVNVQQRAKKNQVWPKVSDLFLLPGMILITMVVRSNLTINHHHNHRHPPTSLQISCKY